MKGVDLSRFPLNCVAAAALAQRGRDAACTTDCASDANKNRPSKPRINLDWSDPRACCETGLGKVRLKFPQNWSNVTKMDPCRDPVAPSGVISQKYRLSGGGRIRLLRPFEQAQP